MEASIKAESLGEGRGATFTIRLPLVDAAAELLILVRRKSIQTDAGATAIVGAQRAAR